MKIENQKINVENRIYGRYQKKIIPLTILLIFLLSIKIIYSQEGIIPEIYKISNFNQITLFKGDDNTKFVFTPDGEKIVYSFENHIWLMNSNGTGKIILTEGENPSISPDGEKIVYEYDHNIYIYNIEDKSKSKIAENGKFPQFDNSGEKVIFMSLEEFSQNLYAVDLKDESIQQISEVSSDKIVEYFTVSPKNDLIAFTSTVINPNTGEGIKGTEEIWIINTQQTFRECIAKSKTGGYPVFSNDGEKIGYISKGYLYIVDLKKGEKLKIFLTPEEKIPKGKFLPCFLDEDRKILVPFFDISNNLSFLSLFTIKGEKISDVIKTKDGIISKCVSGKNESVLFLKSKSLDSRQTAIFSLKFLTLFVNEEKLEEFYPLLFRDIILVPLKPVIKKLGGEVSWDSVSKKIVFFWENAYGEIKPGSREVIANQTKYILPLEVLNIGTITYIPLKFFEEVLGCGIKFESENFKVYINFGG